MRQALRKSHGRVTGIGLAVIILAATVTVALAGVGLVHFDATPGPGAAQITVSWETETEVEAVAFRIVSSTQPLVQTATVVTTMAAVGSGTGGASYHFVDTSLVAGQRYYYWLYEITSNGELHLLTQAASAVAPTQSTLARRAFLPLAFRSY